MLLFLISTKLRFVGKLSQLALKLLCRTPNEVCVDSIGSVLEKHMKPRRPGKQIIFVIEMHIDWNGSVVSKTDNGLIQVKEEGWTGFSEGWHGGSEGFPKGEVRGKSLGAALSARGKPCSSRLFYLNIYSI